MRTSVAVLGFLAFGALAAMPAAADQRVASDKATIKRIMALAETDLKLRQADLGPIGSTLPAAPIAKPSPAPPSREDGFDEATAAPAPPVGPAAEAVAATANR